MSENPANPVNREKFVQDMKLVISDAEVVLRERAQQAARDTEEYVRDNPWRAIGVAAGIGLVLGMILSRR